jgi:uncharacterized protein (TIGR00251 family)
MWIEDRPGGAALYCQIQPRASRSEIVGLHGDPPRLRIRVAAPPVDGEANEALVDFLRKTLKIPRSQIRLEAGHTGKFKELFIGGLSAATLAERLGL